MTSSTRRNIIANFAGSIWTGLMSLTFIPLYIHFMGIESFGLIGFFITLQAVFSLLDLGLSTTINRELARSSALPATAERAGNMRSLLRTMEVIYWSVAIVNGIVVIGFAGLIASRWINPEHLSAAIVERAIMRMGFVLVVQWPLSLYSGGLLGLQKQEALSVVNGVAATLRGMGAVVILWLVSPTITAFFDWQIAISLAHTLTVALLLWRAVDRGGRPGFDVGQLRSIWRFAAGMISISILSSVITQLDKVILSRTLTLEAFGFYALAGTVALSLYRLITPINAAIFPRLSQLAAADREEELVDTYHQGAELMSLVILPAAVVIAFFSYEVLRIWTGNPGTAEHAHVILSLLILGTACNGLLNVPYSLTLAYGWTRLTVIMNSVALVVLIPLILWTAQRYGGPGAASSWLIYNAGIGILCIRIIHRRILRGQAWRWYTRDVARPLFGVVVVAGIGRLLIKRDLPLGILIPAFVVVSAAAQGVAILAVPRARHFVALLFRRVRPLRPRES